MAQKLVASLDRDARRLALVGRIGSDLSTLRFENEQPRITHVAFALREADGWSIRHVMNTQEGSAGHLYRQKPIEFFRDDPFEYRATILVPSLEIQERIAALLESGGADALHNPRYSRISYPFATRYQNSNQWVVEVVGAAQSGATSRDIIQHYLAENGLAPSVLRTVGIIWQKLSLLTSRNTHFDDHPLRERLRGRFSFVLGSSLARYMRETDRVLAEAEVSLEEN